MPADKASGRHVLHFSAIQIWGIVLAVGLIAFGPFFNGERQETVVAEGGGLLVVLPPDEFSSNGEQGGPFSPEYANYTLMNMGDEAISWQVSKTAAWIDLNTTSGSLDPGKATEIHPEINEQAHSLDPGEYTDSIDFVNVTNGNGDTSRQVILTVLPPFEGMTAASRTSGVAPLAVFFDAHSASSGVLQPVDGDHTKFHYEWDFGDDPAKTWDTTGKHKNKASGYVAVHVYENTGSYHVTLTVTDEQGAKHYYEQDVDVSAFSGTTFYISSSEGSDLNDGLNSSQPLRTFSKALSMMGSNRRFLFKCGDQWKISHGAVIDADGPGIIGAYGEGAKPVIQVVGKGMALDFRGSDWRVMDLKLVGPGSSSQMAGIEGSGLVRHLALRMEVRDFRLGISYGWGGASEHAENTVADCNFCENVINNGYLGGSKIAVLGSRFEEADVSHLLRVWHLHKGVISNNVMENPGGDRLAFKFHNEIALSLPDSQYVVVSDNRFRGHVFVVSIAPQNYTSDERISDVVFERNVLNSMSDTQRALLVIAQRVTIRNNVINGDNASIYYTGIDVSPSEASGNTDHRIYNNTIYYGESGDEFTAVKVLEDCTNVVVRNSLASAPGVEGAVLISGGGTGLVADHNLLTKQAGFIDPANGDFSLAAGSEGIDAGLAVPRVRDSINGVVRPQGEDYDLGAYEQ